jgi:hypothetical protein
MSDLDFEEKQPSYWTSVSVAGLLVGVITFIISIIAGYMRINSEPEGSMFAGIDAGTIIPCLMGAFAGMLAVWHYTREVDKKMKLGRGALVGFLAGLAVAFIQTLFTKAWVLIDPDYVIAIRDHMIASYEMMDVPEQQKQMMIDSVYQETKKQQTIWGTLRNFLLAGAFSGIFNVVTGMIGVKIFAEEPEETL